MTWRDVLLLLESLGWRMVANTEGGAEICAPGSREALVMQRHQLDRVLPHKGDGRSYGLLADPVQELLYEALHLDPQELPLLATELPEWSRDDIGCHMVLAILEARLCGRLP